MSVVNVGELAATLGLDAAPFDKELDKAGKGMGPKMKAAAIGAGALVGAALSKGVGDALDIGAANTKLANQLGATGEMAADLGRIAGDLYANGYGESMTQVNDALRGIMQSGLLPEDATNEQIQRITGKAMSLAQTFEQDLGGTTAALGQLLRNGLAKDADEALDLVTRGFQQGDDKAGDLLDTITEYSTQFRELGLTGTEAMGLLSQGLKAGARDSDTVADGLKEFAIRAQDGSAATADGFKSIGLSAQVMGEKIAGGGAGARQALQQTLDGLRGIADPALRSQKAVELFGTKAEDLQDALFALDPSKAVAAMGDVAGAADKVDTAIGSDPQAQIEAFKRKMEMVVVDVLGRVVGVFNGLPGPAQAVVGALGALTVVGGGTAVVAGKVADGLKSTVDLATKAGPAVAKLAGGALDLASGFAAGAKAVVGLGVQAAVTTGRVVAGTAAFIAQKAAQAASTVATGVLTAAQWALNLAMSMNPIMLVVLAIAALVAGIVVAYQNVEWFRDLVDAALSFVKDCFEGAFNWVRDNWPLLLAILTGPIGLAVLFITEHFDQIVGFVTGLPGRIASAASGMWDGVKDAFRAAINWIIRHWNDLSITLPSVDTPFGSIGGWTLDTPNVPEFEKGGRIPGPTGRPRLVIAHGGEFVVSNAMQRMGSLAAGAPASAPAFASGGGNTYAVNMAVTLAGRATADDARVLRRAVEDAIQSASKRGARIPAQAIAS